MAEPSPFKIVIIGYIDEQGQRHVKRVTSEDAGVGHLFDRITKLIEAGDPSGSPKSPDPRRGRPQ